MRKTRKRQVLSLNVSRGEADGSVSPGILSGKVLQRPRYFITSHSALVASLRCHRWSGTVLIMGHQWIHSEHYFIGGQCLWLFWEICVLGQDSCFRLVQSPASGFCSQMDRVYESQGWGRSADWGDLQFRKSVSSRSQRSRFKQQTLLDSALPCGERNSVIVQECVVFENDHPCSIRICLSHIPIRGSGLSVWSF